MNMKKAVAAVVLAVMVLGSAVSSFAADPVTSVYGYNWFRYTLGYDNMKETSSLFEVKRTYVRVKVKADDYEGALTLDYENAQEQSTVYYGTWVKYAYVDLTAIPFLKDAEIKVRAGVIPTNFGTIDTWEYPLIEKALEDYLKVVDSANLGVAVMGYLPMALGNFEIGYLNGNGYKKKEDNLDKSLVASLNVVPMAGLYVRGSYIGHSIGENRINETTGQPSVLNKYKDRKALVLGGATGPIEGFVEALETKDAKAAGKSGIGQSMAAFLKLKVIDGVDVAAKYFAVNPDTFAKRDEYNVYMAGINWKVASKVLLQLNYEMKQNKVDGGNTGAVTNNMWMAQTKWEW